MKLNPEFITNCISILLILSFLLVFFTPDLILSDTTTTGGDMGSHYVLAHYMKNYLLPHKKLIGWYPHWMAGTPMFQFYFAPPYLLMSFISLFVPLEISFKLVTILGVFLLPLTTFFAMRFMGFKFPIPAIASGFTTLLLFLETQSQWGGNIPSTLAGEFSYMISFSLTILLMGSLYLGINRNRYTVWNSVLLAMVVLTHIYTGIFITFVSIFFLLSGDRSRNFIYLLRVFFLAGLISGFWTIPLIAKLGFSAAPRDVFFGFPNLDIVIVPQFTIFYIFAAISVASGILNRDKKTLYFLWAILSSVILILSIKYINLLYIRFVPFTYFIPLLLASDGLGRISRNLRARWLFLIIVVLSTLIWVNLGISGVISEVGKATGCGDNPILKATESYFRDFPFVSHGITYIPSWIRWNYEGLEGKKAYNTFREINDYLRDCNLSGRVDIEYSNSYNKFGTPRVFEVSPVFSNKSVMESLLLESSLTFPFFYYIQKEMSQDAWWPGFPIEMPSFDPDSGVESLRLYNVQYFIASSKETKDALDVNDRFHPLKEIGEFKVYAINEDSRYVEVPRREPVLVITDNWKQFSYDWFSSDYRETPLVFSPTVDEYDLSRFRIVVMDKPLRIQKNEDTQVFYPENITQALKSSQKIETDCTVTETLHEEELLINTNCINQPLLVKVSYFPNWRVEGAEKIYIASPSLMLIFPEKETIRIYYGETLADKIGNLSSILGILIVFYYLLTKNSRFRRSVHERLLILIRHRQLKTRISLFRERLSRLPDFLRRNWRWFLLSFFVFFALLALSLYLDEQSSCNEFCLSRGYVGGERSFQGTVDHYHLGYNHQTENKRHNLLCTALCDKTRPEMVYVSNGYVQFNMAIVKDRENRLFLRMWDNVNCRSGDLYINDVFMKKIEGNGKFGWHEFEFKIPKEFTNSSRVTIKLEHSDPECYGWDLSEAYIRVPGCRCY